MSPRLLPGVVPVLLILAISAGLQRAHADHAPVLVIPSRPGIPVVISGRDASYAVVEGDWGLSRPGHVAPTVIGGSPLMPSPVYTPRRSYHPRFGRAPPLGRYEIEPPADRTAPKPAESFFRSWSSSPEPQDSIETMPQTAAPGLDSVYNFPGIDIVPPRIDDPEAARPRTRVVPRSRRP
jgi:hypothetical protein